MEDPRNQLLSWCEVDSDALAHNLALFRRRLGPRPRLLMVVKSNAYGHGLSLVTRLAATRGAQAFGVHQADEAAEVRACGWKGQVLILGYVPRRRLAEIAGLGVDFTVYDPQTIAELDSVGRGLGQPVSCHLKLETGTNRQGIPEEELDRYLELFRRGDGVRLAGLSTHFANIEDTTDHSYARAQLEVFHRLVARVHGAGFTDPILHAACTAAILTMPETAFDLSRLGIGAYGIWPSRETLASARTGGEFEPSLRPVLCWKTRVAQVKWVPAGSFIGYGCTHRTGRRTRLAVVPIGYADGYDRGLSGLAHVLVRGSRAQVLGRICMNLFMADITDIEGVEAEDEVVLLGRQGGEEIRATDLAASAQTIPYEILSRISPALPRVAVDAEGRTIDLAREPAGGPG